MLPARRREQFKWRVVAALCCVVAVPAGGVARSSGDDSPSRVRSEDRRMAGLIDRGIRHSATFRLLIDSIQTTDGIVQIESGGCPRGVRACLRMSVQVSGANRLLRISIDMRHNKSDLEVIASIGHELGHAIEGLSERAVTNRDRLYNFFRRYAPTDGASFETTAAVKIGDAIRNELRAADRLGSGQHPDRQRVTDDKLRGTPMTSTVVSSDASTRESP